MRRATDRLVVVGQECIGQQVEWMTLMGANIRVGKYLLVLAHDESAKWPFPVTDEKRLRSRIGKFVEATNRPFGPAAGQVVTHAALTGLRLTMIARITAGMPMPDA